MSESQGEGNAYLGSEVPGLRKEVNAECFLTHSLPTLHPVD